MDKPNIFIRGIYSTALTKIFLDAGYPIIFPSKEIQKRFNLAFRPSNSFSKDVTIRDRLDCQGVSIMFKKHIWDILESENFKDFPLWQTKNPNLIIFKARFHKNSIYRGLIVKSNSNYNYSYIRLTPDDIEKNGIEKDDTFTTTIGRYGRYIPDSNEGIFQVSHEDCGQNYASLGSFYTIPGDLVVIVPYNNKVIISKEITSGRQKKRLFDLGKEFQQSKKYGFIFRTAAELASNAHIQAEMEQLELDLIKTQQIITKFPEKIGEIYSNYRSINILFPAQVKSEFDKIRRMILPTIEYHHSFKSIKIRPKKKIDNSYKKDRYHDKHPQKHFEKHHDKFHNKFGEYNEEKTYNIGELTDFTEELLDGVPNEINDLISQNFLKIYYNTFIQNNQSFSIFHQKLSGKRIQLTSGYIKSINNQNTHSYSITLKRKLREGGNYDGLNTPIEYGDYAIGEYTQGSWYYKTSYFSKNRELKGRYFNINTPIEISSDGIHYIDLEIDVIENMVGERKIIDKELLDHGLEMGIISDEMHSKAMTLAENILEGRI